VVFTLCVCVCAGVSVCVQVCCVCVQVCCVCAGERNLRQMLADALQIANCAANPEDREAIKKAVADIQSMVDALAELRAQGKVGYTGY
jgi:hypothetical protein